MDKQIKIGCVVFIIKDNQLLLGKRKSIYGTGSWGLPGGHLEYGEKLIDAVKRELKEETGIDNAELSFLSIVDDVREDQHYLHASFKLENFDGNYKVVEPDKCEEWKFFSMDNLPENIFIAHIKSIKAFKENKIYI